MAVKAPARPARAPAVLLLAGVAAVVVGLVQLADPEPDPGFREYRPGTKISSDEEVISVRATGESHTRRSSEKLRVRIEINGKEIFNQLIDESPWVRHYILAYGSHLRIDVSQGYTWGKVGCTIHRDQYLLEQAEGDGKTTVSCAYHG